MVASLSILQYTLVYLNFPLSFSPNARNAARFSICAEVQEKGREMNEALFALDDFSETSLWSAGKSIVLQIGQLATCLPKEEVEERIENEIWKA